MVHVTFVIVYYYILADAANFVATAMPKFPKKILGFVYASGFHGWCTVADS